MFLGFTSKTLLANIFHKGVLYIDSTYKIVKYNHNLIILVVTDVARQVFPIAFMFTSHDTEEDFDYFFQEIRYLAGRFAFEFEPDFIVMDANQACYNSVVKIFDDCKVVMCYFQLKKSIRENKNTKNSKRGIRQSLSRSLRSSQLLRRRELQ